MENVLRASVGLATSIMLLLMAFQRADAANKVHEEYLVYISTAIYTTGPFPAAGKKEAIHAYRFNTRTGRLTALGVAVETINPGFLAVHPSHNFLYTVNEVSDFRGRDTGGVTAFAINRETGKLKLLNDVVSQGGNPCYLTVDKTGKHVLVANYYGGRIEVFPVLEDGRLGEASVRIQHTGASVHPVWQTGPHPHSINLSPDNRYAIVPDLGLDRLVVYRFNSKDGSLTPNSPPFAEVTHGAGPRHIAFSPNGRFIYAINNIQAIVSVFSYDSAEAVLRPLQTISALPKEFKGENTGAEIGIAPSGKFLYTSNRGHDSIAVFSVDSETGMLASVEYVPTQGKTPRNFAIDPSGSYLIVGNQDSNTVVVFRIDPHTGKLTATDQVVKLHSPICVLFVPTE